MSLRLPGFSSALAAAGIWLCCASGLPCAAGESTAPAGAVTPAEAETPGDAATETIQFDVLRAGSSSLLNRIPQRPVNYDNMFMQRRSTPMPKPTGPASRRSKEAPRQQGDWVYLTPEEVMHEYMMKEILQIPEYTSDGRDVSSLSPVERYYERTSQRHSLTNSTARPGFANIFGPPGFRLRQNGEGEQTDDDPPVDISGKVPSLKEFSKTRLEDVLPEKTISYTINSDSFKRDELAAAAEVLREQKLQQDHLDAVKKIWNFQQPPPPAPLPQMHAPEIPLRGSAWNVPSGVPDGKPGSFPILISPATLTQPVAAMSPGIPSMYYPAPPQPPPAHKTPMKTDFSIPVRKF